jgi:hypothetical protein
MKKFAANYLVSDTGGFLKNGIVQVGEDGVVARYIDTQGDLIEIEQLIFHNGILIAGCQFTRTNVNQQVLGSGKSFQSFVLQAVLGLTQISIQNLLDLWKQLQLQFPEMRIPAIMNEISEILMAEGGFLKETIPGIYLLSSVDLVELHFKPNSRLKKIL